MCSQCLHHLYAFCEPFLLFDTQQLYDIDGDGKLTLNEIQEIARAIYNLLGYYVTPPYDKATSDQHAARIFTKLDRSRKGFLLKDEFVEICSRVSGVCTFCVWMPVCVFLTAIYIASVTWREKREKERDFFFTHKQSQALVMFIYRVMKLTCSGH